MTDAATEGAGVGAPRRRGSLHHRFVTPESIYGTILFCAVIAAADDDGSDREILLNGVLASLVLWFAHVVAMTVARHGSRDGKDVGVRAALTDGLHHSTGVLIGPFIPLVFLALGAFDVLDGTLAYYLALGSGALVLLVLGIVSCRERRVPWSLSIGGGLAAAAAGMLAVIMKATLLE